MGKVNAFRGRVFRPSYEVMKDVDATNGGISSICSVLYVASPYGTVPVDEKDPALLEEIPDSGTGGGTHLEPVNGHRGKGYTDWMYGGNVLHVERNGKDEFLRIHDRQETWEAYEGLSR